MRRKQKTFLGEIIILRVWLTKKSILVKTVIIHMNTYYIPIGYFIYRYVMDKSAETEYFIFYFHCNTHEIS